MVRAPSLSGVILAAGESTRMGTDKALLPWPPSHRGHILSTFLSASIDRLTSVSDFVIVVVGRNEPNLAPVVYANGASLVRNPSPERGQFSSLQIGLQEVLNRGRDAAFVTLVDRPPAAEGTLTTLHSVMTTAPYSQWAFIPEYQGKHGHPVLLDRSIIQAFLDAPPTSNAREVEHQNQQHIAYIAVDDPFVTLNVNTPEDYAALVSAR